MRPVEDPFSAIYDMVVDSREQSATTKKTSIWEEIGQNIAAHLNKTLVGYIKINKKKTKEFQDHTLISLFIKLQFRV